MSTQFQIPLGVPVRITYPDGTSKTYRKCVGYDADGMKYEDDGGETVVDNRPYLDVSVKTSSGWQKVA